MTSAYEAFVVSRWGNSHSNVLGLSDLFVMTAGLGGETGEVLEKLKKYVRDGEYDRNLFAKELGDVLFYLTAIALRFEFTLEEIMQINVAKLTDRDARGVMRGSGDNR